MTTDSTRRARDVVRTDESGSRRVCRACGDDAGLARPRRFLDARAAQRAGGCTAQARPGSRLHQPDGRADPRREARWEDVTSLRIWVRPKRLRKRAQGSLRHTGVGVFTGGVTYDAHHLVRDAAISTGAMPIAAPVPARRRRQRVGGGDALCLARLLVGGCMRSRGGAKLLRMCVQAVDADIAVAMVNPGEERTYLAAGSCRRLARSASSASA